jgi:hypothetical protein
MRKEVLPMSLFSPSRIKAGILICSLFIFSLFQTVCFSYEFQIVDHFKNPLKGPVGYLTYHSDGHLYATKKASLGYENRIFKIDPSNGEFAGFIENTDEVLSQLKYITSCNSSLYVDHYPPLFNYLIYSIDPEENIWTTFVNPMNQLAGGMACDGFNLILTDEKDIFTVSLIDQEETSRTRFITLDVYDGMTWDGEYLWAITSGTLNRSILHRVDPISGTILEKVRLPSTLTGCRGLSYDEGTFWTFVNGSTSPYNDEIVQVKLISGEDTTTISSTTTTSPLITTTTTVTPPCLAELLYGEGSEEVATLRYIRDTILDSTPEGRELTKLYYAWNHLIVSAVEEDVNFKETVKETVDRIVEVIAGE